MGQAKQRRLAREAGRPWPEDLPKVIPHEGEHLGDDGEWHPYGDRPSKSRGISEAAILLSISAGAGIGKFNPRRGRRTES